MLQAELRQTLPSVDIQHSSDVQTLSLLARLEKPAAVASSAVITGLAFLAADGLVRRAWNFNVMHHFLGGVALYVFVGIAVSLPVLAALHLRQVAGRRWLGRWPLAQRMLGAPLAFLVVALLSIPTGLYAFSGDRISRTPLAAVGPIVFVVCAGVAGALFTNVAMRAAQALERGRVLPQLLLSVGLLALSCGVMWLDLHAYVALYDELHTMLEAIAAVSFAVALLAPIRHLSRRLLFVRKLAVGISLAGVLWSVIAMGSPHARAWLDGALRHVWLEDVYAGRMLRRVHTAAAFVRDPLGFQGLEMARVEALRERFHLTSVALDQRWQQPLIEPPEVKKQLAALRAESRDRNVVVFYVDTLRADTAHDPATMPRLAAFTRESLHFTRAYATGSDTLRSLPSLTGGNYDVDGVHPNDLLDVARRADYERSLFIAKSSAQFLAQLRPTFKFDHTLEVADFEEGRDVWGYGADEPTAARIVEDALLHLESRRGRASQFMWLFHSDLHNWRELKDSYVDEQVERFGIRREDPAWRYRAVAAAVDAEFGRFLAGLKDLGLEQDTIVLFVSDHGEGLGRDGFWVHSVFLWESLVRVPLVLRIPGFEPRAIHEIVSLVDVAPTLARFMLHEPSTKGYQGEDLLRYIVEPKPERRLPILMTAASRDMLVRSALLDTKEELKLVLSYESALPELYALNTPDPDSRNIAELHAVRVRPLLDALVHSPVFPRNREDFDMRGATPRPLPVSPEYLEP